MVEWILNTEQIERIARAICMDIPQYISEHSEEFASYLESEQNKSANADDSNNIM